MTYDPKPLSPPASVHSWISKQAMPIRTLDPQASLEDLASFEQVVGNTSIVGLGEASHGAHEFFVLKHRLLKFLVERLGFTMFAMEADWTRTQPISDYVLTGTGEISELLQGIGYGIWKTQEVLDLLEWMRSYNADPEHVQKVHFAGFDCLFLQESSLEKVVQFFQVVDPERSSRVRELYQNLPQLSPALEYTDHSLLLQSVEAARHVSELLKDHEQEYTQRSSPQQFAVIVQEARIAEQVTQQIAGFAGLEPNDPQFLKMNEERERFMAENINWLHEHAPGGKKMVLWAHNWHIGTWGSWSEGNKGPYTWMGMRLRERYHDQYLTIGFSFFEGALNAKLIDQEGNYLSSGWQPFQVKPAMQGSYNETLAQAGSCYLLDMRSVLSGEVGTWFAGPHPFRLFDTDYFSDERRFYHLVSLPQWYDAILHIREISPSHMLTVL